MKKKIAFGVMAIAMSLVFFGCTTFRATGLSFMPASDNTTVIGHFSKAKWVHEFLGISGGANLFNVSAEAMNGAVTQIIWEEIQKQGGNAATNISIKYSYHVGHMFLNWLTGNIYAPAKIKVEGDVIKMGNGSMAVEQTEEAIEIALENLPEQTKN